MELIKKDQNKFMYILEIPETTSAIFSSKNKTKFLARKELYSFFFSAPIFYPKKEFEPPFHIQENH